MGERERKRERESEREHSPVADVMMIAMITELTTILITSRDPKMYCWLRVCVRACVRAFFPCFPGVISRQDTQTDNGVTTTIASSERARLRSRQRCVCGWMDG